MNLKNKILLELNINNSSLEIHSAAEYQSNWGYPP